MTRATVLNLLAYVVALILSLAAVAGVGAARPAPTTATSSVPVIDRRDQPVPAGDYRRIVSLTILSDPLLLELVEPERFIAACRWSSGPLAFKLGTRPRLGSAQELEAILALHPDLVIAASSGADPHLARLRVAGIVVYDGGNLDGWATCQRVTRDLGRLLGADARAEALLDRCRRRLAAVAARPAPGLRGMYVGLIQDRLFGGTDGTAYHDVLTGAGLVDAAAERFTGWPQYSIEDILALDPDVIVTDAGQGEMLRRLPGAQRLRARVIELPGELLQDPGLLIVDAVERLHASVLALDHTD